MRTLCLTLRARERMELTAILRKVAVEIDKSEKHSYAYEDGKWEYHYGLYGKDENGQQKPSR